MTRAKARGRGEDMRIVSLEGGCRSPGPTQEGGERGAEDLT